MAAAVAGIPNVDALSLDFFDRTRIASWVRSHAALIPWVRGLVGRAIHGWQSYGAWAYAADGVKSEYLLDDKLRVHPVTRDPDQGLSAVEGLQQIRKELSEPRHVARLVGLSGVGKTRLVQALFDERVGERSLDPSIAIYTNMADGPDPLPIPLASNLTAAGTRAILVIDNCPPDLHHRLSEVCRQLESKLSVITVEYDVKEDDPEGTEVFTLEPSFPELIETLVRRGFPQLSPVDAHTIAESSGGNARIALALAGTVEQNETIAGLTDEQLFQRLFQQRHGHDESLYLIAQACSLIYSFQGEDVSENETAELVRLGRLIGKSPQEVYRGVAELRRRDLVQRRSVWRAVLPHAIANRLAATALQNIPYEIIEPNLITPSSEHLTRSLSRRLGYLDASPEAAAIVQKWLDASGLLANVAELNDLGAAMFKNVAPVLPEDALASLERAILGPGGCEAAKECKKYCDLLRSLAYEAALFERVVALLAKISIADALEPKSHATQMFTSLFHLILSGTHATIEQRVVVIESLLASSEEKERTLGVLALKAVLEALHFHSVGSFEFGARSRDYGYWPRDEEEIRHWFSQGLRLVETIACGDGPTATQVRAALSEQFRGLWLRGRSDEKVAAVCLAIRKTRFWPEGWNAVRQALDFDRSGLEQERRAKLVAIENALRPTDLLEQVRAVVVSSHGHDFEDHAGEDITARMARAEALAQDLGKAVADDEGVRDEILPQIVSGTGRLLWWFGQGLSEGTSDPAGIWQRLIAALTVTESAERRPQALRGFLFRLSTVNPPLANALLDEAVEHPILAEWYPFLQVAVPLGDSDITRLRRSVELRKAPAGIYEYLKFDSATDPIPAPGLKELILGIATLSSGLDVAIEVLQWRLDSDKTRRRAAAQELIDVGRDLLRRVVFTRRNDDRGDRRLGEIAATCLIEEPGAEVVLEMCGRLKYAVVNYRTSAFYHDDLLVGMFRVQPAAALEGMCGGDKNALELGIGVLRDVGSRRQPLAVVPDADLLNWCDVEPHLRYPAMASVIPISERAPENASLRWTTIALRFLEKAPDPSGILAIFTTHFRPNSWSGSLAEVLASNTILLDQLGAYPELAAAVAQQKEQVQKWIEEQRLRETAWGRQQDERFE